MKEQDAHELIRSQAIRLAQYEELINILQEKNKELKEIIKEMEKGYEVKEGQCDTTKEGR